MWPGPGRESALAETAVESRIVHPPRPARRAIVFNRVGGIKSEVYAEGTHLMLPWFERPIIYDVRARPNVITSTSGSRDLQMVRDGRHVGAG